VDVHGASYIGDCRLQIEEWLIVDWGIGEWIGEWGLDGQSAVAIDSRQSSIQSPIVNPLANPQSPNQPLFNLQSAVASDAGALN
jgi:hypothetical protein